MKENIRVLILDDDSSVCWSLAKFLDEFGFDITTVENAEDGLFIMDKISFHAGIIDIRLPGMDGEAFIIEAHKKDPNMLFLVHTGSSDFELSGGLQEIGVRREHIFIKPLLDLTIIKEAIENLLK